MKTLDPDYLAPKQFFKLAKGFFDFDCACVCVEFRFHLIDCVCPCTCARHCACVASENQA